MFSLSRRLFMKSAALLAISTTVGTQVALSDDTPKPLSPEYPFEGLPNPGIPNLQVMTQGAANDEQALTMISDYFTAHQQWLSDVFEETNLTRLQALYAMFIIHISHIYGEANIPPSLVDYVNKQRHSHCGVYTVFQAQISQYYGLAWRVFTNEAAEHSWVEVKVDGQWEVFDSTNNVWITQNGYDLLKGVKRIHRNFYTPMNDITRPDARESYWIGPSFNHLVGWYNPPRLRMWVPGLGLYYNPPTTPDQIYISSSVPGEGGTNTQPWLLGASSAS